MPLQGDPAPDLPSRQQQLRKQLAAEHRAQPALATDGEEQPDPHTFFSLQICKPKKPKPRTYLTGLDPKGKRRLIVEVTSVMSQRHYDIICQIRAAVQSQRLTKPQAVQLRQQLLEAEAQEAGS